MSQTYILAYFFFTFYCFKLNNLLLWFVTKFPFHFEIFLTFKLWHLRSRRNNRLNDTLSVRFGASFHGGFTDQLYRPLNILIMTWNIINLIRHLAFLCNISDLQIWIPWEKGRFVVISSVLILPTCVLCKFQIMRLPLDHIAIGFSFKVPFWMLECSPRTVINAFSHFQDSRNS